MQNFPILKARPTVWMNGSQGCHKKVIGCHFGTPGAAGMGLDAVLDMLPLAVMYLYLNPMLSALLYDL